MDINEMKEYVAEYIATHKKSYTEPYKDIVRAIESIDTLFLRSMRKMPHYDEGEGNYDKMPFNAFLIEDTDPNSCEFKKFDIAYYMPSGRRYKLHAVITGYPVDCGNVYERFTFTEICHDNTIKVLNRSVEETKEIENGGKDNE